VFFVGDRAYKLKKHRLRWMDTNDAGHMVRRALIALQQTVTEHTNSDRQPADHGTQPA
jgi:hypothetical protein